LKLHSTFGDFNKDGLKDVAVILVDSIYEKITGDGNRSLIILRGTKNGYILSSYCDSAVLCIGCGGVHGDPFESVSFTNNQLVLKHIVGSSYRSELTTRFRYQNGNWVLIGETIKGCFLNAYFEKLKKFGGMGFYDKNHLTGEYIQKERDEMRCELIKDYKEKGLRKPLIKLSDYNITSIWSIRQ
jgi:hypothetical protein